MENVKHLNLETRQKSVLSFDCTEDMIKTGTLFYSGDVWDVAEGKLLEEFNGQAISLFDGRLYDLIAKEGRMVRAVLVGGYSSAKVEEALSETSLGPDLEESVEEAPE